MSSAQAALTHSYTGKSFGPDGTEATTFQYPGAIAVNQTTGDVFVLDKAAGAIDRFNANGEAIDFSGSSPNITANQITGIQAHQGGGESQIAVDSASGHIYLAGGQGFLQAFQENGEPAEFSALGSSEITGLGEVLGVAADSHGNIYAADYNSGVHIYAPSGQSLTQFATPEPAHLAVDSHGDVYVDRYGGSVSKYVPSALPVTAATEYDEPTEPFDPAQSSSVAVSPADDVYVNEHNQIAQYNQAGIRLLTFASSGEPGQLTASDGVAVAGTGGSETLYVSTFGGTNQVEIFGPQEVQKLSIDSVSVANIHTRSAELRAQINPHQALTTYHFEFGTTIAYGNIAPTVDGEVGSGNSEVGVSQELAGLQPGISYHFRVVATNANGTVAGPDQTFGTYPVSSVGLPDGRVDELVSPADKNGFSAGASVRQGARSVYSIATANGDGILYEGGGPLGSLVHSGYDKVFVARRLPGGWGSSSAIPRSQEPVNISSFAISYEPSRDLSRLIFTTSNSYSPDNPAGAGTGESSGIYLSQDGSAATWLSRPDLSIAPDPAAGEVQGGDNLNIAGGSADLSTVYFGYFGSLLPADATREAAVLHGDANHNLSAPGFYEYHDGVLSEAGILPHDSGYPDAPNPYGAVPAGTPGASFSRAHEVRNQVSADGSKAFFVSPSPEQCRRGGCNGETPELYVRVTDPTGVQRTELVSRSDLPGHVGDPALGGPAFMIDSNNTSVGGAGSYVYASSDGSQAFFASCDRLTADAPSLPGCDPGGARTTPVNSYDLNLDTQSLTYLHLGVGRPSILVSTSDGSEFLSTREVNHGAQELDLWRASAAGGSLTKVADLPVLPGGSRLEPRVGPARISADGRLVIFQTDSPIPGSNDSGGFREVFRYDVESGQLSCLSCPLDGVTPSGDASLEGGGGDGAGGIAGARVESRGMSASAGRVFFDTSAALVSRDTNGVRDVYEWEEEGIGSCAHEEVAGGCLYLISAGTSSQPSFFLDNSESGNDVFIATAEGIDLVDADAGYDVYDSRIGGGFATGSAPCSGDACQPVTEAPVAQTLGSASFAGPGNPPPTYRHHRVRRSHHKNQKNAHRRAHRGAGHKVGGRK